MYELMKITGRSYAYVHEWIKKLRDARLLCDFGKRHIERKPGKRRGKFKHNVTLWGLSYKGIWALILADRKILNKWDKIKENYDKELGSFLEYFELMLRIGSISEEYGFSTRHDHPSPRMVAQALLFVRFDKEKIESIARACSNSMRSRIIGEIKREGRNLESLLQRCNMLEQRLRLQ
jgi:hypothetical protein